MVSWVAEPSPRTAFNQQRPVSRRVPFATGRLSEEAEQAAQTSLPRKNNQPLRSQSAPEGRREGPAQQYDQRALAEQGRSLLWIVFLEI